LLGTTLDFAKELGELSGRLIGRTLAFGLHQIPHERNPDPLVDLQRQSPQQLERAAMSSDFLLVRQHAFRQLVDLRLEVVQCGG